MARALTSVPGARSEDPTAAATGAVTAAIEDEPTDRFAGAERS
jgi:hypothetical protein